MAKNGNGKGADTETPDGSVMEQKVTREIRFKLTAEEQQKMANDAAKLTEERNAKKTELDIIGRTMRKEIKDTQKEIDRLLKCHKDGTEAREVEVIEQLDWNNKTVRYYHTGANGSDLIDEREMHDSELQMKLNTNPSAKKVKKDNRTRAQKNPDKHLTPEEQEQSEVAEVHKLETSKKTKKSAVDKNLN